MNLHEWKIYAPIPIEVEKVGKAVLDAAFKSSYSA